MVSESEIRSQIQSRESELRQRQEQLSRTSARELLERSRGGISSLLQVKQEEKELARVQEAQKELESYKQKFEEEEAAKKAAAKAYAELAYSGVVSPKGGKGRWGDIPQAPIVGQVSATQLEAAGLLPKFDFPFDIIGGEKEPSMEGMGRSTVGGVELYQEGKFVPQYTRVPSGTERIQQQWEEAKQQKIQELFQPSFQVSTTELPSIKPEQVQKYADVTTQVSVERQKASPILTAFGWITAPATSYYLKGGEERLPLTVGIEKKEYFTKGKRGTTEYETVRPRTYGEMNIPQAFEEELKDRMAVVTQKYMNKDLSEKDAQQVEEEIKGEAEKIIKQLEKKYAFRESLELIAPSMIDIAYNYFLMAGGLKIIGSASGKYEPALSIAYPTGMKAAKTTETVAGLGAFGVLGFVQGKQVVETWKKSPEAGLITAGISLLGIVAISHAGYKGYKEGYTAKAEEFFKSGKIIEERGVLYVKKQPQELATLDILGKKIKTTAKIERFPQKAEAVLFRTVEYPTPKLLYKTKIIKTPTIKETKGIYIPEINLAFAEYPKIKGKEVTGTFGIKAGEKEFVARENPLYITWGEPVEKAYYVDVLKGKIIKKIKIGKPTQDIFLGKAMGLGAEQRTVIGYDMGFAPTEGKIISPPFTKESPFAVTSPLKETIKGVGGKIVKEYPNWFRQFGIRAVAPKGKEIVAGYPYTYLIYAEPEPWITMITKPEGLKKTPLIDSLTKGYETPSHVRKTYYAPGSITGMGVSEGGGGEGGFITKNVLTLAEEPSFTHPKSPFINPAAIPTQFEYVSPEVQIFPFVKAMPETKIITIPEEKAATVPVVVPETTTRIIPAVIPKTIPVTIPTTIPKTIPTVISKTIPTVIPQTIPKVIPAVIPTVVPKTVPKVIPKIIPKIIPKVIPKVIPTVIPIITPPVFGGKAPSQRKKLKIFKAWQTFVKRRKKLQVLGLPTTKGEAIRKGEKYVRATLGATFLIRPRGTVALLEAPYEPSPTVFRKYRIKRGMKIPLQETWIQKARYRLSAPSEVMEIQRARGASLFKTKKKKNRRFKWF